MSRCSWAGVLISLSCPSALAEPWPISPQVNQWINCSSPSLSPKSLSFITYLGNKTDQVFFRGGSQTLLSASLSHTFLRAFLTPGTPIPPQWPVQINSSSEVLSSVSGGRNAEPASGFGPDDPASAVSCCNRSCWGASESAPCPLGWFLAGG